MMTLSFTLFISLSKSVSFKSTFWFYQDSCFSIPICLNLKKYKSFGILEVRLHRKHRLWKIMKFSREQQAKSLDKTNVIKKWNCKNQSLIHVNYFIRCIQETVYIHNTGMSWNLKSKIREIENMKIKKLSLDKLIWLST